MSFQLPVGSPPQAVNPLTSAGQAAFPYINAANTIPITLAWTYLTTAADPSVTPLLVDGAGHVLMSSRVGPDGRETLAMTFDSNRYLLHHAILAHGLEECAEITEAIAKTPVASQEGKEALVERGLKWCGPSSALHFTGVPLRCAAGESTLQSSLDLVCRRKGRR